LLLHITTNGKDTVNRYGRGLIELAVNTMEINIGVTFMLSYELCEFLDSVPPKSGIMHRALNIRLYYCGYR
jgi:hypothetical protein